MYSYIVLVSILYKYSYFVNIDGCYYVQNGDIKEILGYSRTTKTVDKIIKRNGLLDSIGVTLTTNNFPVSFSINKDEDINNIPIREYNMIDDLNSYEKSKIKNIVKNRNYNIKEPVFLTSQFNNREYGTMYDYTLTHKITISELIKMFSKCKSSVGEFTVYSFIKSRVMGGHNAELSLSIFNDDLRISKQTFYNSIKNLKINRFINVYHVGWQNGDSDELKSNSYSIIG